MDSTVDWTMDWVFLYEMSSLDDKVQHEGQMGVLPSPSPSLDVYNLVTTITFFFIQWNPS